MSGNGKPRTIKLFCPSVSKLVQFVAWEEQKLDLGSIARSFGLDPSTVKLNGHFISRGVDLVSASVTWRSLLSFFSAKGLSTGSNNRDALIVDGKLCKVGTKRAADPQDGTSGNHHGNLAKYVCNSPRLQTEDMDLVKNKKLRESSSGCGEVGGPLSKWSGLGFLKRKQLMEDVNLLKKLKINETNSSDISRRGNENSASISSIRNAVTQVPI
ncbi:hypothetical protein SLE2022_210180 [Rubroshorea leprosula]